MVKCLVFNYAIIISAFNFIPYWRNSSSEEDKISYRSRNYKWLLTFKFGTALPSVCHIRSVQLGDVICLPLNVPFGSLTLPIPQIRVSSLHCHVSLWLWPIVSVGLWNSNRRQRKIMLPSEILTWWIMIDPPIQLSSLITSFDKYFRNDDDIR